MRYREYRRKCKETKERRLAKIARFNGNAARTKIKKTCDMKHNWEALTDEGEPYDYAVHTYRTSISSFLKKQFARKFRRSSKINMIAFKRSDYKRASGDFWWEIS